MARTKPRPKKKPTKSGADDLWSVLAKVTESLAEQARLLPASTTCGCCGQRFTDPEVLQAHLDARAYKDRRKGGGRPAAPRPAPAQPTPSKTPPPRGGSPRPASSPKPAPARGGRVATHPSVQMINNAGSAVPEEVDEATKLGDLDTLLLGLRYAQLRLAEGVSELADRLVAEVWLDPDVAQAIEETSASIAESAQGYQEARRRIRVVYAEQIEASSKGRRQPRSKFFEE